MRKILIFSAISFVCLLTLLSCSSAGRNPLVGEWRLTIYTDPFKATLDPTAVSAGDVFLLRINTDHTFSFSTDCNTISGNYRLSARNLQFFDLSATELACGSEIVERSVKTQFPMVKSFDLTADSTLCLLGGQGNVLMRLSKYRDDDCPFPTRTDADRKPLVVLKITADSLLACCNRVTDNREDPLILDTTNPGFPEFLAQWISSLDSVPQTEIRTTSALHITVGSDVSDATFSRVKAVVRKCGIDRFSVSNFDISE
ncbi:MAG: META domain-containing protein [Paramuribaculum sp.]|nr:META domain-containing protein [Paramuribaculum sp.]